MLLLLIIVCFLLHRKNPPCVLLVMGEKYKEKPKMAPLLRELSNLEVEPLEIIEQVPGREIFDTPLQESNLETLTTLGDVEVASILKGKVPVNDFCCCCCCPACCC